MKIDVWFSCGAASAVATLLTLRRYPDAEVRVINNPVQEEHPDNERFLHDIEKWLDIKIIRQTNTKLGHHSAERVWIDRKFMSSPNGAVCTGAVKAEARTEWERNNPGDALVMGFVAEEAERNKRFVKFERSNVLPVLINGGISKQDCFEMLAFAGIDLPYVYRHLPNANCIGCVKVTSINYWAVIRKIWSDIFIRRAELSRQLGVRLTRLNGERIFLDEIPFDYIIKPIGPMPDCGIFCEMK